MSENCLARAKDAGTALEDDTFVVSTSEISVGKASILQCSVAECSFRCTVQIEGVDVGKNDGQPVYSNEHGFCEERRLA